MCEHAGDTLVNEKTQTPGLEEDALTALEHSILCAPSCLYTYWSVDVDTCGTQRT